MNVPDQDGLRLLLDSARIAVSGLKHLWLDVGYDGRGKHWVEEVLGLSVEIVRRPPKPIAGKRARTWSQEEWAKEGKKVDWQKLMPLRGFRGIAEALGCGTHLLVALSEQADEQRLREAVRHR